MKKLSKFRTGCLFSLALFFVLAFGFSTVQAQTTAFNFQGRLNDGSNPANGRYDLQFKLYDAIAGGNQVGTTLNKPNLMLSNGVFSTQLDFGGSIFTGSDRFIEISLRPTVPANVTPNAFVILGGRQQIMSVPYSVKSLNATNADNATNAVSSQTAVNSQNSVNSTNATNAMNATTATTAQTAVNSQQLGGVAASQYLQKGGVGTVKAMLYVNVDTNITRCYNSTLSGNAATTPPCGFTVNNFTTGGYGINFGFNTASLLVSVSGSSSLVDSDGTVSNNPVYATFSYPSGFPQNVNVFTWGSNGSPTGRAQFSIFVY